MRERLTTLGELVGMSAVTAGAWDLSRAFGLIVGGVCLVVVSFLESDR